MVTARGRYFCRLKEVATQWRCRSSRLDSIVNIFIFNDPDLKQLTYSSLELSNDEVPGLALQNNLTLKGKHTTCLS